MHSSEGRFYRRNLPHWQPYEATFSVTYRLHGSLPKAVISQLTAEYELVKQKSKNFPYHRREKERNKYFFQFDEVLDKYSENNKWLGEDRIAETVLNSLLFFDRKQYILWAGCIMPNHVHALLSTLQGAPSLTEILQSHKKFTAVNCNRILKRQGSFWQHESYDTIIRNAVRFANALNYILNNPVKAGLVKKWSEWKWTYVKQEIRHLIRV